MCRNFSLSLAASVIAGISIFGVSAIGSLGSDCQKPSEDEELCDFPEPGMKALCFGYDPYWCDGYSQYVVARFPVGTEKSNSGLTAEEPSPCMKTGTCAWNGNAIPEAMCEGTGDWTRWSFKAKIVVKQGWTCNEE